MLHCGISLLGCHSHSEAVAADVLFVLLRGFMVTSPSKVPKLSQITGGAGFLASIVCPCPGWA